MHLVYCIIALLLAFNHICAPKIESLDFEYLSIPIPDPILWLYSWSKTRNEWKQVAGIHCLTERPTTSPLVPTGGFQSPLTASFPSDLLTVYLILSPLHSQKLAFSAFFESSMVACVVLSPLNPMYLNRRVVELTTKPLVPTSTEKRLFPSTLPTLCNQARVQRLLLLVHFLFLFLPWNSQLNQ